MVLFSFPLFYTHSANLATVELIKVFFSSSNPVEINTDLFIFFKHILLISSCIIFTIILKPKLMYVGIPNQLIQDAHKLFESK